MRGVASAAAAVRCALPKALVSAFAIVTVAACLAGCNSTPNYPFIVEGYMEMQPEKQTSVNLEEYIPTDVKVVNHDCTDFDGQAFYWLYQYTQASNGINCVEYESLDNIQTAFNISYSASDDALIRTNYSNPYAGTVSQVNVQAPQIGSIGATSQSGYAIETSPYLFTVHTKAADFADCICVIYKDGKEPVMAFFYAKGHGIVLGAVKSEKRSWFINSEAARITYYETASTDTAEEGAEIDDETVFTHESESTSSSASDFARTNNFGEGGTFKCSANGMTVDVEPIEDKASGEWKAKLSFSDGAVSTYELIDCGYSEYKGEELFSVVYRDSTGSSLQLCLSYSDEFEVSSSGAHDGLYAKIAG